MKQGDRVEVELVIHARGVTPRSSIWKPGVFDRYEGPRLWVRITTPSGQMKRSFPASKVRKV